MPVSPLLRPDNRFIGPATSDLSLYGGQPGYEFKVGAPAGVQGADQSETAPTPTVVPPDAAVESVKPAMPASDEAAPAQPADATSLGVAPTAPAIVDTAHSTTSPDDNASVAGASTPPSVIDALAPSMTATGVTTTDINTASESAAHDAVTVVAQQIAGDPSQLLGSSLTLGTAGAAGLTGGLASAVVGGTGHVVSTLADGAISATAAAVPEALGTATHAISPLVSDLANGAGDAVHALADAVGSADGSAVADLAALPGEAVDALGHVDASGIDGLGGSDPAGGVSTLVEMVSTADLFTFDHGVDAAPAQQPSTSIVDDLIGGDAAAAPILGDTTHVDHVGDAAGSVDHTLDHVLGGL